MVSHPELGSDQPFGSDRESGRDNLCWPNADVLVLSIV